MYVHCTSWRISTGLSDTLTALDTNRLLQHSRSRRSKICILHVRLMAHGWPGTVTWTTSSFSALPSITPVNLNLDILFIYTLVRFICIILKYSCTPVNTFTTHCIIHIKSKAYPNKLFEYYIKFVFCLFIHTCTRTHCIYT